MVFRWKVTGYDQRATPDQLDELNFEQKCSLQRLWKPKRFDVVFCTVFETVEMVDESRGNTVRFMGGNGTFVSNCYPLLSIKQMTEFLERNLRDVMSECSAKDIPEFLCDKLWDLTKHSLDYIISKATPGE